MTTYFPSLCVMRRTLVITHGSNSYRGISPRSWPFSSIPPHISESFSFVSPGNRSTFFKLSFKEKKRRRKRKRGGVKKTLTHFVMPFDHTFIFKTDGWPPSCLYQDSLFEIRGPDIRFCVPWNPWIPDHRKRLIFSHQSCYALKK